LPDVSIIAAPLLNRGVRSPEAWCTVAGICLRIADSTAAFSMTPPAWSACASTRRISVNPFSSWECSVSFQRQPLQQHALGLRRETTHDLRLPAGSPRVPARLQACRWSRGTNKPPRESRLFRAITIAAELCRIHPAAVAASPWQAIARTQGAYRRRRREVRALRWHRRHRFWPTAWPAKPPAVSQTRRWIKAPDVRYASAGRERPQTRVGQSSAQRAEFA